jgi:small subunit ribosomal protein S9
MNQNNSNELIWGTGRRKNAIARVRMIAGEGRIAVNEKSIDEYFAGLDRLKQQALKPTTIFPSFKNYDFDVIVTGGGITGQAGAISLSLARAFVKVDPAMKQAMRKEGLLTRDPRMVERKKSGQPKARKRFQFSKR